MKFEQSPRSRWPGLVAAAGAVALTTALIYLLRQFMPVVSTGVVYLIGVMLVSIYWGFALGLFTAVLSSAAFNWFHIPPTGRFTIANSEDWVALVVFAVAAAVVSTAASAARLRATEAEERRREADLTAEMARLLLGGESLEESFSIVGQRLAEALELSWAQIDLQEVTPGPRQTVVPLAVGEDSGSLLLPAGVDTQVLARLRERIVPALEALLRAAVHRYELQVQVVETEALRRSDEIKTALLRATSHDLRSPLTTILASAEAASSPGLDGRSRSELLAAISSEAGRLARLVEKLLDLSRLQAGAAAPRLDWCSIEEVLNAAVEEVSGGDGVTFELLFADELPLIRADAAQLERAFVNLFENARRFAGKSPVVVNVNRVANRLKVQIVDRGSGIAAEHLPHVFKPFYRVSEGSRHTGSGLGLAIAKGFVEANGGSLSVDSLPGQGATFTVQFEIDEREIAVGAR